MRRIFLILICALMSVVTVSAQRSLQELIDSFPEVQNNGSESGTRSTAVTYNEIDLSANGFSGVIDPVTVNGRNIRFINGSIYRNEEFHKPLLTITGGGNVEIGKGANIYANNRSDSYHTPIVLISSGSLTVLENGRVEINPATTRSSMEAMTTQVKVAAQSPTVVSETDKDYFYLQGGYVSDYTCNATDAFAWLLSGQCDFITSSSSFFLSGSVSNEFIGLSSNAKVFLKSSLDHDVRIHSRNEYGSCVIFGEGYMPTKSDIEHIEVYGPYVQSADDLQINPVPAFQKAYLRQESNQLILSKDDPNSILETADDLQKKLNDIAAKKTATEKNPEAIVIPEKGIVIDKLIRVPEGCHAVISGGPITIQSNIGEHFVFWIFKKASLTFDDVTIDFLNNQMHSNSHIFNVGGKLLINKGTTFVNYPTDTPYTDDIAGLFYLNEGVLEYNSGMELYTQTLSLIRGKSGFVTINAGLMNTVYVPAIDMECSIIEVKGGLISTDKTTAVLNRNCEQFNIYGGTVISYSTDPVADAVITNYSGGKIIGSKTAASIGEIKAGAELKVDSVIVRSSIRIDGDAKLPVLYLMNGSMIRVRSKVTDNWIIDGDWKKFQGGDIVVQGDFSQYTLTEQDFQKMTFVNLPSQLVPIYDNADKCVKFKKLSLQEMIDGFPTDADGNRGTENDPASIKVGEDGLDIDEDVHTGDGLQGLIDSYPLDKTSPAPKVYFKGGDFYIDKGSTVTFRNLDLEGQNGHHIYVSGKLIIDININIYTFTEVFIHVTYGGTIVWRGGNGTIPGVVIINEGGSVVYEGGSTHGGIHGISTAGGSIDITGGTIGGSIHGIHVEGGTVNIHGGTIVGGGTTEGGTATGNTPEAGHTIYNGPKGTVVIDGGNFGGGSIWNEGGLTLGGDINFKDIYINCNTYITVISKITIDWYIYFINKVDIDVKIPLIKGGNGYTLTEQDLLRIHITLPTGYQLTLDKIQNAIYISLTSGISGVAADAPSARYYDVNGIEKTSADGGISIVRYKDGSVKKIIK